MQKKGKCLRTIGNQEYEVKWDDDRLFYLPAAKQERRKMLKHFVTKECEKCWQLQPAKVSTLKREFLRQLIDSFD